MFTYCDCLQPTCSMIFFTFVPTSCCLLILLAFVACVLYLKLMINFDESINSAMSLHVAVKKNELFIYLTELGNWYLHAIS